MVFARSGKGFSKAGKRWWGFIILEWVEGQGFCWTNIFDLNICYVPTQLISITKVYNMMLNLFLLFFACTSEEDRLRLEQENEILIQKKVDEALQLKEQERLQREEAARLQQEQERLQREEAARAQIQGLTSGECLDNDGLVYELSNGMVVGCGYGHDEGNWCSGSPRKNNACMNAEIPAELQGQWSWAYGFYRGWSASVSSRKVSILSPNQTIQMSVDRIFVQYRGYPLSPIFTFESTTSKLYYVSMWETEKGVYAFGFGSTKEASKKESCQLMK